MTERRKYTRESELMRPASQLSRSPSGDANCEPKRRAEPYRLSRPRLWLGCTLTAEQDSLSKQVKQSMLYNICIQQTRRVSQQFKSGMIHIQIMQFVERVKYNVASRVAYSIPMVLHAWCYTENRKLSWYQLCCYLVAPDVVVTTTYGDTGVDKAGMTILGFQSIRIKYHLKTPNLHTAVILMWVKRLSVSVWFRYNMGKDKFAYRTR